ncbi:Mitochondrial import inner membrane translocase subunit TIM23-2 [Platanthera zijinensis]|uniref:Mitochondrial import inner membrane translocase subunit TIM23-2 n=1 Tax=Platanthera zijinensis TaxID=2320716 RepID=A0AAP0C3C3_9ASPA
MADPRIFGGSGDSDRRQDPSRRLYDPYKDLQIPYRSIYDLPTSPEFLFQEESTAQRRSWGENLTFYTGIGYLGGAGIGAALGLYKGEGRRMGNRLGIIGLLYAGMESGMVAARGSDDWINSVIAGLGTGALYKAANGPRSAAIAGALGGLMAGAAMAGKQVLKRHVPV